MNVAGDLILVVMVGEKTLGRSEQLRDHGDVVLALRGLVDILWIVAGHGLAIWAYGQSWRPEDSNATILAIVVFLVTAHLSGLYRSRQAEQAKREVQIVVGSWAFTVATLIFAAFATKSSLEYSRLVSFGWFSISPLLLLCWRSVARTAIHAMRASGRNVKRIAILGATASGDELCAQIHQRPWLSMNVVGVYDDRAEERRHPFNEASCRHLGGEEALLEACRNNEIDAVYIALPLRAEDRIADFVRLLADTTVTVHLVADFFNYDLLCARWSAIGDFPLISIYDTPFRGVDGWIKRLEDIVVGTMIVLLISLPLLIIALLVKLTSPGPIFFRQRRYGLNGKEIRILKFRSMTVCEDGAHVAQATRNDSRVTKLGRFLRRSSLDELPQFLQVLTGEMSVVGPRPHAVSHNEQYRSLIHGYMLRHKVKPGITGWAQVNGWRGETPDVSWMERRVQHDLEYIEKWSLIWDLKIILLTVMGRHTSRNAF
jgi:putative colanic acid biosynthesis UDP-glucose lipid carrier transferase